MEATKEYVLYFDNSGHLDFHLQLTALVMETTGQGNKCYESRRYPKTALDQVQLSNAEAEVQR